MTPGSVTVYLVQLVNSNGNAYHSPGHALFQLLLAIKTNLLEYLTSPKALMIFHNYAPNSLFVIYLKYTQFLGFEFISTEKFVLFSNENFQSIEKYLNLKHTGAAIEVDSSSRFKLCFFQVSIRHFFTIMVKDAWNNRLT